MSLLVLNLTVAGALLVGLGVLHLGMGRDTVAYQVFRMGEVSLGLIPVLLKGDPARKGVSE